MTISMDKKYVTKGGKAVRILAIDLKKHNCVVGAVSHDDGRTEAVYHFSIDGTCPGALHCSLIEVKDKVVRWVNVYLNGNMCTFDTKEDAVSVVGNCSTTILARRIELEVD